MDYYRGYHDEEELKKYGISLETFFMIQTSNSNCLIDIGGTLEYSSTIFKINQNIFEKYFDYFKSQFGWNNSSNEPYFSDRSPNIFQKILEHITAVHNQINKTILIDPKVGDELNYYGYINYNDLIFMKKYAYPNYMVKSFVRTDLLNFMENKKVTIKLKPYLEENGNNILYPLNSKYLFFNLRNSDSIINFKINKKDAHI